MKLYDVGEIGNHITAGFKVTSPNHVPCVSLGFDQRANELVCLALGSSIRELLKHPDDASVACRLLQAHYGGTTAGMMLTAQHVDEVSDGCALVLVNRCYMKGVGETRVESSDGHTDPELLMYAGTKFESRYDLFLFKEGNGLYLHWDGRLRLETKKKLKLRIWWDGQTLHQEEVPDRRHSSRQRDSQPAASQQLEVRAEQQLEPPQAP